MLPSKTVIGYVGGRDPWISVLETTWPEKPLSPPKYVCRGSRRSGVELLTQLVLDTKHFAGATVVAVTDEIDAQAIAELGYEVVWVRVSTGAGAIADEQARSCLIIPVAEMETVLRRLVMLEKLMLPESLKALGARAGDEISTEDQELLALGAACWYSFGRDDGLREQPQKRRLPRAKANEEDGIWDETELSLMEWVRRGRDLG